MDITSFDTETTSLDIYRGARVFSYSICDTDGQTGVMRLDHKDKFKRDVARWSLHDVVNKNDSMLAIHNAIFDIGACRQSGIPFQDGRAIADTMVMSHILRSNARSHALDELAWELGGYEKGLDKEVNKIAKKVGGYKYVPKHIMEKYQRLDAERCMALYLTLWPRIQAERAHLENYKVELDMIWTTLRMVERGVLLKQDRVLDLLSWLDEELEMAVKELEHIAGRYINPDSPPQIAKLLYKEIGLPIIKRTDTGLPSTEKEVLFELHAAHQHPVLHCIAKFRSYSGARKSLLNYLGYVDENSVIHPNIRPTGAKTGRQSISQPALMGVSKEAVLLNPYPVPSRQCFGPRPGNVWFCIDYKGIQALLLVGRSGDEEGIKIFKSGRSMHDVAASIFYGNRYKNQKDPVKKKQLYNSAKNANFAKPFGAGMTKMLRTLGLPKTKASRVKAYEARFPRYCGLNRVLRDEVKESGYITTTHGRQLYMPKKDAYMGANYFAQGEEACIMKRAEIRVDNYLEGATGGEAGLVFPIHDEIVIEYPRKMLPDAPEVIGQVCKLMTDFPEINVPLGVDVKVATVDWSKTEEVSYD